MTNGDGSPRTVNRVVATRCGSSIPDDPHFKKEGHGKVTKLKSQFSLASAQPPLHVKKSERVFLREEAAVLNSRLDYLGLSSLILLSTTWPRRLLIGLVKIYVLFQF